MQTAVRTNSFLIDSFSFGRLAELQEEISHAGFYQQLASELIKGVCRREVLSEIANRLVNLADHAYILRQMGLLEQISQTLLGLPLARKFRSIARYYLGFCLKRKGEFDRAQTLFERVAEEAPIKYRARALIALGSVAFDRGDLQSVLPLYAEARRATVYSQAFDPLATFYTQHMFAVLRSISGDNRGALADLERMFPIARAVGSMYPPLYGHYLNSLAVEFSELGRFEEARNACRVTLASPFANAYPEWRETGNEVALRGYRTSRSLVAYSQTTLKPENVLHLPERGDSFIAIESCFDPAHQPASVINFEDWKKKMVKEPNGDPPNEDPSKKLDEREMLLRIIQLVSQPDRTENELESILKSVEKIVAKKKDKS